jgi:Ca-activated chloride channel homolog
MRLSFAICTTGVLLLAAIGASPALGQGISRATQADQPQAVFAAASDLVVAHVTVTERRGAYVSNLTADAFHVFENGEPQPVSFFAEQDAPVTAGLIIDDSGSMWHHRERVIAAASAFAHVSNPDDELFALAFNERVREAFSPRAPFTNDAAVIHDALAATLAGRGRTALHDAVLAGLDYLRRGTRERRVLIVVSDGGDNASAASAEEMLQAARASSAVIYTVTIADDGRGTGANPTLLRQLANATGGQVYRPRNPGRVEEALQTISRDIRQSYTIGYVPTNLRRDGTFRRIRVVAETADGRRLRVRAREGYLAPTGGL